MIKNYYAILGVRAEDSEEAIRQAYRKLAKQYHPDLNPGDKVAEERFKEIGIAWETLGKPEKRVKYDESLRDSGRAKTAPKRSSPQKSSPPDFSDFTRGFQGFDDLFHTQNVSGAQAGQSSNHSSEKNPKPAAKNPLDTSELFKKFMGF